MSDQSDEPPTLQRERYADAEKDYRMITHMPNKLHEIRMEKIRECLTEARRTNWIYIGNAFREKPPTPSKP